MRKLLDWIADKLGYQRKFRKITWPQTFIPDSVMKGREDDNCLPPNYIFPHFPTQELIDYCKVFDQLWENAKMEIKASTFDPTWISDSDAPAPTIRATLTKKID